MSVSLIVGIDPGAGGAIAFISAAGDLLDVTDMPCDVIQKGKHVRSRLSRHRMMAALGGRNGLVGAAGFIEMPTYRPMKKRNPQTGEVTNMQMGSAGSGALGEMFGGAAMALVAAGAVLEEVPVNTWRNALHLQGGKDDARRMAANLYPSHSMLFARKKDDGRAEAVLIARYGWLKIFRGTSA